MGSANAKQQIRHLLEMQVQGSAYLVDHPLTRDWIERRFDVADRQTARAMVAGLKLVSHNEFESHLAASIQKIAARGGRPKRRVALFPVAGEEGETPYDSSGRVAHLLAKLAAAQPRIFTAGPTMSSMRQEKVTDVILVDDIIGTGRRFTGFWKRWGTKSLKSWVSYGVCDLWLVAYCGLASGVERVAESVLSVHANRIRVGITVPPPDKIWTPPVLDLIARYPRSKTKASRGLGFGGSGSPIVFAHGCPNNAPYLIWAPPSGNWAGLFPGRHVPPESLRCFDASYARRGADVLWDKRQRKVALRFIDHLEHAKPSELESVILAVLGLLAAGVPAESLASILVTTHANVEEALAVASKNHLVDGNYVLSEYGAALLEMFKKGKGSHKTVEYPAVTYYPRQYGGIKR